MKILMINGSPHPHGCTDTALHEMEQVFQTEGIETELLTLDTDAVRGCTACGGCKRVGRCVFDDVVNAALEKAETADGFVFGSPVHYAALSGTMTAFLDRFFYASGGFPDRPVACVVSCRRAGSTAALDQMLKYPMISNMPVVPSQYWPMVHGARPDDVQQDLEGLQTMRQLARNMVWMLRCIEAGKAAGIPRPEHERHVWTNFIR